MSNRSESLYRHPSLAHLRAQAKAPIPGLNRIDFAGNKLGTRFSAWLKLKQAAMRLRLRSTAAIFRWQEFLSSRRFRSPRDPGRAEQKCNRKRARPRAYIIAMHGSDYGAPLRFANEGKIRLYEPEGFEGMRRAGQLVASALDLLAEHVRPGITTEAIDRLVFDFAMKNGAMPATLNYRGYPKSCCTSLNHVVCHGIPGPRVLVEGDVLNVDVTLILNGWHGDSSRMFTVGRLSRKAERLIEVTHEAMMRGISVVKPGATIGDIGYAIQRYAESERCSIVRDFCGHGVGLVFHDKPNILHYGTPGEGAVLEAGMIFTVEPMINLGKPHVKMLSDGWTAVTRDRSLSAQFEHSVGVTAAGVEIFTLSPRGWHQPPYPGQI
jgi:methionyl aminopeptidase